jgi:hypothetical protein
MRNLSALLNINGTTIATHLGDKGMLDLRAF